jgi:hypothetical protein
VISSVLHQHRQCTQRGKKENNRGKERSSTEWLVFKNMEGGHAIQTLPR